MLRGENVCMCFEYVGWRHAAVSLFPPPNYTRTVHHTLLPSFCPVLFQQFCTHTQHTSVHTHTQDLAKAKLWQKGSSSSKKGGVSAGPISICRSLPDPVACPLEEWAPLGGPVRPLLQVCSHMGTSWGKAGEADTCACCLVFKCLGV
jgi:hypothetical protein